MKEAVTRNSVAKMAGVSAPVVTWVANGTAKENRVSQATIKRVKDVIQQTGYKANIWGRMLRTKRSHAIALVSSDLQSSYAITLMHFLGIAAQARDYSLIMTSVSDDINEIDQIRLSNTLADGAVFLNPSPEQMDRFRKIGLLDAPYCVVNSYYDSSSHPNVTVDFEAAGTMAIAHLAEKGASSIGLISDRPQFYYSSEMMRGCRKQLEQHPEISDETFSRKTDEYESMFETGMNAIKTWHEAGTLPDSIFAFKDVIGLGVLNQLRILGIDCPGDVKVLGTEATVLTTFSSPPMTSVAHPIADLVEHAMDIILEQLDKPGHTESHCLKPYIEMRAST